MPPTPRTPVHYDPTLGHNKVITAPDTVATAALGSGVADTTTFLRGDGTWSTPPAAGADEAYVYFSS